MDPLMEQHPPNRRMPRPWLAAAALRHATSTMIRGGKCADPAIDPRIFDIDDATTDPGRAAEAFTLCQECLVQPLCLAHALAVEPFGIWGGVDAVGRARMRGGPIPSKEELDEAARLVDDLRARVPTKVSASRLGVTTRSVERWRAAVRRAS